MTKHDKKILQEDRVDPALLRQVQAAVLAYMAENDGQMPSVAKVHETVKGSFRELTPAVRLVKERLLATQTRLAHHTSSGHGASPSLHDAYALRF